VTDPARKPWQRWTETIENGVADLLAGVQRLIAAGNTRRLLLNSAQGRTLLDIPLTAGAVIGGVLALQAPLLVVLGVVAVLLLGIKFVIVKDLGD